MLGNSVMFPSKRLLPIVVHPFKKKQTESRDSYLSSYMFPTTWYIEQCLYCKWPLGSRIYIRELGKEVQYAVIRGKEVLIPSQEIMLMRILGKD